MKLIGTLNYETGEIFCVEEEKYDAEVFLRFLEKVLAHYPHGKIVMILDNARIHHAKLIQPFLVAHKNRLQCNRQAVWFLRNFGEINNLCFSGIVFKRADVHVNSLASTGKTTFSSSTSSERNVNELLSSTNKNVCILSVLWITKYPSTQFLSSCVTGSFYPCTARYHPFKITEMVLQ